MSRLEARIITTPSLDVVKMEERKRPGGLDDNAPPAKRQAVAVNGSRSHQDADLPWKDDIESAAHNNVAPPLSLHLAQHRLCLPPPRFPQSLCNPQTLQTFQKDAIWRQMKEYKREKTTLEAQIADMEKRTKHYDHNLRTLNEWFDQMVEDIRVILAEKFPDMPPGDAALFERDIFSKHLGSRKEKIAAAFSGLYTMVPRTPEVIELQQRISRLLAAEKEHLINMRTIETEKEQLSERLDAATLRYMTAEKRIDRMRSAQIQKLERQAIAHPSPVKEEASAITNGSEPVNGTILGPIVEEMETARDAAIAEVSKRKEQLEKLEEQNKQLTEQVNTLNIKLSGLSDEDYVKSDCFKILKGQHEDVIKRINHLEATNIQLRTEAQKSQAERTAYRMKVEDEARASTTELEGSLVRAEADLNRIRGARDELVSKLAMVESERQNNDASKKHLRDMVSACEDRISALESERELFKVQLGERAVPEPEPHLEGLSPEQLRKKISSLEIQLNLLSKELPSMEAAYKKVQAAANIKIGELIAGEEQIARANADKVKADQKYFGAMKSREAMEQQIRILRVQASKSTEIVAQLKEEAANSRSLVAQAEKKSTEAVARLEDFSDQYRAAQQKLRDATALAEAQMKQIGELKKMVETKDPIWLANRHALRDAEAERDRIAAQIQGLEKQIEHWKQKSAGNQSDEAAMMQQMLQCQVCKNNFKDTIIKTCGHVFCASCIQDRLINRARKCPNCAKAFGNNDTMRMHW
ncbi:BRE1-domain-containing protein [Amniculicola lignicola CBS 123094]|uniref:E3 ubiquitin protein ligase n=1 Tax=Amniculicola lignicola CBS 123094 TaxID=1392246 RepID=A0A6A5WWM3_9PLEO|nr:BRE1-domain-containing protein [Amniculicola lignicola CBS 123094]